VYVTYSMYKMATASVPNGTILAVHLQKCLHLSNEIRVMQNCLHSKTFMIYFLTFTGKIAKPWFAISLERKKTCLPALKNFPMLGETNNQFYMAVRTVIFLKLIYMYMYLYKLIYYVLKFLSNLGVLSLFTFCSSCQKQVHVYLANRPI
jgi:hypothetical protein